MASLTADLDRRIERLSRELEAEFPNVPTEAIEQDLAEETRRMIAAARFDDFVPVLVHRAVRGRLRVAA